MVPSLASESSSQLVPGHDLISLSVLPCLWHKELSQAHNFSIGFFQGNVEFRNQDLRIRDAHYQWHNIALPLSVVTACVCVWGEHL